MKLHVGCGRVYLRDYLNVDVRDSGALLAADHPDLVGRWITDEEHYYARQGPHETLESFALSPSEEPVICDAYGSLTGRLPCDDGSCEEVLMRQVFEHLSPTEVRHALIELDRVLIPGGIVRVSVPDVEASLDEFRRTGNDFFKRHILGTRRNAQAYHCIGWTRQSLIALFSDHAFHYVIDERNPHIYPALCLVFRKPPMRGAAWRWTVYPSGEVAQLARPAGSEHLEIGPGSDPWPHATVYYDIDSDCAQYLPHGNFVVGDMHSMPEAWTDYFDFALCSHVLEHVADPARACAELVRVARAGLIACPSPFVEALFAFHEPDHQWLVIPRRDRLLFLANDGIWQRAASSDMSGVAHRLFRLGPARLDHDSLVARRWWHENEPYLNVFYWWDRIARPLTVEVER